MPGAVARTSTFALNNATLPFILALADKGAAAAMLADATSSPTSTSTGADHPPRRRRRARRRSRRPAPTPRALTQGLTLVMVAPRCAARLSHGSPLRKAGSGVPQGTPKGVHAHRLLPGGGAADVIGRLPWSHKAYIVGLSLAPL